MAIIQNLEAFVQSYPAGLDSVTDLQLSQNENGRQIRFTIGGVTIPAGSVATISGTKPDGVVYSNTGTIEGSDTVIFDEDVQMTAVFGTWYAKIRITNAGNTIASARVRFIIDKDPVDAGAIPSESQLDGLVAEAEEYAEAAEDAAERAAITYGSPLTAATASAMTDINRVYVYTGSESGYTYGNWYYYNGSAWVSGGVYNSAAVETDTTLTESGVPADAKATGDDIDELKDDLDQFIEDFGGSVDDAVNYWLDEHPEATTTVEDHSLTYEKLVNGTLGYVTPEMYGASGDGVTDDTTAITAMLNSGNTNIFLQNTYLIDTNSFVVTADGTNIFGGGTLLAKDVQAIGNYYLLSIYASNVIIENITCDYQRDSQTVQTDQEWGHCFVIGDLQDNTKSDITVKNCKAIGANGDGFSIRSEHVTLINCTADNCRRNGFTVVSEFSRLLGCKALNTNGTLPEVGLDIEPDSDKDINCDIVDFYSYNNNMAAITVSGHNLKEKTWNINIKNLLSVNDGVKIGTTENYTSILNIEGGQLTTGEFNVNAEAVIINPQRNPVRYVLSNTQKYNSALHVTLIGNVKQKPVLLTKCTSSTVSRIFIDIDEPSQISAFPYYNTYQNAEPVVGTDETNQQLQYVAVSYNGVCPDIERGSQNVTISSGSTYDVSITFTHRYDNTPMVLFSLQNTENGVASKMEHVSAAIRTLNTSGATIRLFNYADASLTFNVYYMIMKLT